MGLVSPVFQKPVGQIWKFQKNEITNSKKTTVHFKMLGQNRIQKLKTMHSTKFIKL
jgi:hypothetical protein